MSSVVYCLLHCYLSNEYLKFNKVFFAIINGSLSLGYALPELQTFATALGSATAIYAILDRVSFSVFNFCRK